VAPGRQAFKVALRQDDGCATPMPGDALWAFVESAVDELAKVRFRVLELPFGLDVQWIRSLSDLTSLVCLHRNEKPAQRQAGTCPIKRL
jgi:hypothetical protein